MKKAQLIEMLEFIPDDYEVLANGNVALGVIKDNFTKSINIYSDANFTFHFPHVITSEKAVQDTAFLSSKEEVNAMG